jgi:hypothetical protein
MSVVDKSTFSGFPSNSLSAAIFDPASHGLDLTREAAEILSVVLEQLEAYPSPQRGVLLFSNDPGTDRSRLLHYLSGLLEDRGSLQWTSLLRRLSLSEHALPKTSIRSLFIQIPRDPSIDLRSFFLETLWQEIPRAPVPPQKEPPDELLVRMRHVSAALVKQSLGLIVLENVSDRIRRLNDAEKLSPPRIRRQD